MSADTQAAIRTMQTQIRDFLPMTFATWAARNFVDISDELSCRAALRFHVTITDLARIRGGRRAFFMHVILTAQDDYTVEIYEWHLDSIGIPLDRPGAALPFWRIGMQERLDAIGMARAINDLCLDVR